MIGLPLDCLYAFTELLFAVRRSLVFQAAEARRLTSVCPYSTFSPVAFFLGLYILHSKLVNRVQVVDGSLSSYLPTCCSPSLSQHRYQIQASFAALWGCRAKG